MLIPVLATTIPVLSACTLTALICCFRLRRIIHGQKQVQERYEKPELGATSKVLGIDGRWELQGEARSELPGNAILYRTESRVKELTQLCEADTPKTEMRVESKADEIIPVDTRDLVRL